MFLLKGTIAKEGEISNFILQSTLASIMEKINAMDSRLRSIEGVMTSLKKCQKSMISTHQNYQASYSGHAKKTSTTTSLETLYHMYLLHYKPMNPSHKPLLIHIIKILFIHFNSNLTKKPNKLKNHPYKSPKSKDYPYLTKIHHSKPCLTKINLSRLNM